ncbi:hypothetical protein BC941DRAFT_421185 [Chlamydoabsidia padenii]|nr:hypothetical protein BC941DRAFT_421185 [Chlamydoabsidia padenii]
MSPPTSPISPSSSVTSTCPSKKRRRSSADEVHRAHPKFSPLVALPPPMVSYAAPNVAYYPVYTNHNGQFYIASPPLDPTPKLLPKLPTDPPTPSSPYTFYHPYQLSPPPTTAHEREQARKVSHSAIERRRRERINDKIMQLKQLIPTCANQDNLHKMSILQSSIDYITYLKDVLQQVGSLGDVDDKMHKVKTPKSMLPKEVEPYTSQFNANQPTTQQCLKPMDIIMSGSKKQPSSSDLPSPTKINKHLL